MKHFVDSDINSCYIYVFSAVASIVKDDFAYQVGLLAYLNIVVMDGKWTSGLDGKMVGSEPLRKAIMPTSVKMPFLQTRS